ncbi:MAG: methyltransferase domain-containing protein [Proteobacteria bacterium]|nr:methyltransferase domain-containing protein [Pseudomonadota bacterium]
MSDWYTEHVSQHEQHRHAYGEVLYEGQTRWQSVKVVQSHRYGKILMLDDDIQSAQGDERLYHEVLVHPALISLPRPARSVLIMGGGEGATLREILRHRTIERVVMIDLDGELVDICKEHMPEWAAGAFEDPRLELHADDARAYIDRCTEKFDCVIHDLPQPLEDSPLRRLFSRQCFERVRDVMHPDGVMCMQACSAKMTTNRMHHAAVHTARQAFAHTMHAFIPSFSNDWGYCVASSSVDPFAISADEIDARIAARVEGSLEMYSGAMHHAMLALPPWFEREQAAMDVVIDDDAQLPARLFNDGN